MKKFGFYYKIGKDKELISKGNFNDYEEAVEYFSAIKKLPVQTFLKIYKVVDL